MESWRWQNWSIHQGPKHQLTVSHRADTVGALVFMTFPGLQPSFHFRGQCRNLREEKINSSQFWRSRDEHTAGVEEEKFWFVQRWPVSWTLLIQVDFHIRASEQESCLLKQGRPCWIQMTRRPSSTEWFYEYWVLNNQSNNHKECFCTGEDALPSPHCSGGGRDSLETCSLHVGKDAKVPFMQPLEK